MSGNPASRPGLVARTLVLLYGLVIYNFFFGTFLWAAAFAENLTPVSLDHGRPASLLEALLVNGGFLGLFAIQHTIMARPRFKQWLTRFLPRPMERATFVLVTCVILCGMFWQWRQLPGGVVWSIEAPLLRGVMIGISAVGWLIVLLSTFMIGHFELFGLKQPLWYFLGRKEGKPEFRMPPLYRSVRHPIMTGFMIAFWAAPTMTVSHLFFAAGTTGYIVAAVFLFEERDLIGMFGDAYRDYKRRVPALVPLPFGRKQRGVADARETAAPDAATA